MSDLITAPNLPEVDRIYAQLLAAHRGLTPEDSAALNARLILILMNHVGDAEALGQAIDLAQDTGKTA